MAFIDDWVVSIKALSKRLNSNLLIWRLNGKMALASEIATVIGILGFILYQERGLLFSATSIAPHDNYFFLFPIFSYFADSIIHGIVPLWNPYSHGGEPFYPLLVHAQLLDPTAWLVVLIGKTLTQNLLLLFHWNLILHSLLAITGTYLLLRRFSQYSVTRVLLLITLGLSSFSLVPLRQPGFLYQYQWAPWILLSLFKLFEVRGASWRPWLLLGLFLALQSQSYWFTGISLFLLLTLIAFLIFKPFQWGSLSNLKNLKWKLITLGVLLAIGVLPNVSLLLRQKQWMSPMRTVPTQSFTKKLFGAPTLFESDKAPEEEIGFISYEELVKTGSFSSPMDFLQLGYPAGNSNIHPRSASWGKTSEAWMYIGWLPLFFALLGICFGREENAVIWKSNLVALTVLSLGPNLGIFRILFYALPPLWFLRHLHTLQPYILLCLFYFFVLGSDLFWNNFIHSERDNTIQNWLSRTFLSANKWGFSRLFPVLITLFAISFITAFGFSTSSILEVNLEIVLMSVLMLGYLLWRQMGKGVVLFCFILLLISQNALLSQHAISYLFSVLICLLIPLVLTCRKEKSFQFDWLTVIFCAATLLDLISAFKSSHYLYSGQPSPALDYGINLQSRPFSSLPRPRIPVSNFKHSLVPRDPGPEQEPRYLSLLDRTPAALSELWTPLAKSPTFEQGLNSKRWNSFILERSYHRLIHSGISESLLAKLFLIGSEPYQWLASAEEAASTDDAIRKLKLEALYSTPVLPLILETLSPLPKDVVNGKERPDFKISHYDANRFELEANSERGGYFYWSDGYDADWQAEVDGISTAIYKANVSFKAIRLRSGTHSIRFYYRPWFFIVASSLYMGALFILGGVLLVLEGLKVINPSENCAPLGKTWSYSS